MAHPSGELLKRALARKKGRLSLRGVAQKLELSPSFLSAVMNGKKRLPSEILEPLARALDMDAIALEKLKAALIREYLPANLQKSLLRNPEFSRSRTLEEMPHLETTDFSLLQRWYFLAILDLTTCENFEADPAWISQRLGITATQARQAWELLVQAGSLVESDGKWQKNLHHIRFPTRRSQPLVRSYHDQMLTLAREELGRAGQTEFERRLIAGLSVAVNPVKVEEAKLKIQATLVEVAKILAEGPCTEVYQFQIQLFPVTRAVTKPLANPLAKVTQP